MDFDDDHSPQPAPALAPVASNRPAKVLRAGDQRVLCQALAADWWREACEAYPQGSAGVARYLGVDRPTAHRYGTGERLLPVRDLLAAPAPVQERFCRRALDRLDERPLSGGRETLEVEALVVCADAAQLALLIERGGQLERLDAGALDRLIDLVDGLLDRLFSIRRRLQKERAKRAG